MRSASSRPWSVLAPLAMFAICSHAVALSCVTPDYVRRMSPEQRLQHRMADFDMVFAGVPVEQEFRDDRHFVKFRVLRVFKGSVPLSVTAVDNDTFSGPTEFSGATIYLVFAWHDRGAILMSNECEHVITLGDADKRPKYDAGLGKGWRPH